MAFLAPEVSLACHGLKLSEARKTFSFNPMLELRRKITEGNTPTANIASCPCRVEKVTV